jgi:hypothetical protein
MNPRGIRKYLSGPQEEASNHREARDCSPLADASRMVSLKKCLSIARLLPVLVFAVSFSVPAWAAPEQVAKLEFFESKIRPMFAKHCYECHSAESGKSKGDLLLDSRAAWQVGGESGPAIIPGKPDDSLLFKAIRRSGETPEMPPKTHLPPQVISDFRKWIADGAIDPREGKAPVHQK